MLTWHAHPCCRPVYTVTVTGSTATSISATAELDKQGYVFYVLANKCATVPGAEGPASASGLTSLQLQDLATAFAAWVGPGPAYHLPGTHKVAMTSSVFSPFLRARAGFGLWSLPRGL